MSSLIAILRPAGVLGDRQDTTYQTDSVTATIAPLAGTLSVKAPSLMATVGNGSIDYVVIGARAMVTDPSPPNTDHDELTWAIGAAVVVETAGPWSRLTVSEVKSSNRATDPNGSAWTWAALMSLGPVGANVIYSVGIGESVTLDVMDVFVEVWGTSYGPFVYGSGVHGGRAGDGAHGNLEAAGTHGGVAGQGEHGNRSSAGLHGPVYGSGKMGGG